jgi:hypothetical protein
MAVSFDGENLLITLESGVTNLDWMDVYSDWKDWMLASPVNRKYPEAFRTTGGDPLNSFLDQGRYWFIRNDYGWRIKPPEEDITIYASGNLAAEDADLPIFVPTTGAYTAAIIGLQPITQGINQTLTNSLQHGTYEGAIHLDPSSANTGTTYPVGTHGYPVNNLADALLIDAVYGFNKIIVYDDIDLNDAYDLDGYTIVGSTSDVIVIIDTLASVNDMTVENITMTDSVLDGNIHLKDSIVRDISYINGYIHNCGIAGTITLGGNKKSVLADCYTVDQDNPPTINMGGSGNDLAMPNYSGLITITNLSGASNEIGIGLDAGMVTLSSSISAGTVIVAGIGVLMDNSTGGTINTDGLIQAVRLNELWQLQGLDADNPITMTPSGASFGTITQTYTGDGETSKTVTRN